MLKQLNGRNLSLRLASLGDASYIYTIRTNNLYNKYLSTAPKSIEDQRTWLIEYKKREQNNEEAYYIIQRHCGLNCGLVRLYEITENHFTWGSWILDENKTPKAAIESAMLSLGIGFDYYNADYANIDVRIKNKHAIAFYSRLNMTETHRTDKDIFYRYYRIQFLHDRINLLQHIAT